MNLALVEKIVSAVLYEGYMLYPYRPSSVKNRQRWTFGGVYPQAHSLAHAGVDAWSVQTECLVVSDQPAVLDIKVRFLHLLARDIGVLDAPACELPAGAEPAFRTVAALQVGEKLFQTWQEAVEREIGIMDVRLSELVGQTRRQAFSFPASRELELLREPDGTAVGVLVREQQALEGLIELTAEAIDRHVFKATVRILNLTPLPEAAEPAATESAATAALDSDPRLATAGSRDAALLRSFASTHTILGVRQGEFVSLLDPPDELSAAAAGCRNVGGWPVLVGQAGERDLLLASPIILYDYPQIAPESPGDLFDGTEIDEILTLRIMTMTDEEKREMSAVDERARALLDRTEALDGEQLMRLHGVMRSPWTAEEQR
jgi:hydrogenase maturation protease